MEERHHLAELWEGGIWEDNIKMNLEVGCESVESNNLAWEWE